MRDALYKIKDVPSVVFGKANFDPQTRRVIGVKSVDLVVKDGKWALSDAKGKASVASAR